MAALLIAGLSGSRSDPNDPQRPLQCPHYWSDVIPGRAGQDSIVPLSGDIVDVPEYNDCQRLIVMTRRERRYGPLAAVFAAKELDLLPRQLADHRGFAIAAATVLSLDGPYMPLGIARQFNCLYLWREVSGWKARMVPRGQEAQSCLRPLPLPSDEGRLLEVRTNTAGAARHPAVTRWEYDRRNEQQYIGIKCGEDWCEIGPQGFVSSGPPTVTADWQSLVSDLRLPSRGGVQSGWSVADFQSVNEAPGAYDQQFLSPARGGPRPTTIFATVFPEPNLGLRTNTEFQNAWRVVSLVWIPETSDPEMAGYTAKYGYRQGWNAVSLCLPDATTLAPGAAACATWPSEKVCGGVYATAGDATPMEVRWYARVDSRTSDGRIHTDYSCSLGRPYYGSRNVPGTSRWRWLANDETVWQSCVKGCCEVENP